MNFTEALEDLIDKHRIGNKSNTDASILARYLVQCLFAYEAAVGARNQWHYGGIVNR